MIKPGSAEKSPTNIVFIFPAHHPYFEVKETVAIHSSTARSALREGVGFAAAAVRLFLPLSLSPSLCVLVSSFFPHHHLHLHISLILLLSSFFTSSFQFSLISPMIFHISRLIRPEFIIFCSFFSFYVPKTMKKEANEETIFDFLHFGRFRSPNSDLCDGQARANCETFWRVKSMCAHLHVMPMTLFSLKRSTIFNWTFPRSIDAKIEIGLIVKLVEKHRV